MLRLVLIEGSIWAANNLLSHFDGSFWQLSLYLLAVQGSKKPFEWLGRLISSNRIFPAVSEKSTFACKRAHANVFFTYERHILNFYFILVKWAKHTKTQRSKDIFLNLNF